MRALLFFGLAGALGYVVDAGVLMLAAPEAGPYVARLLSFFAAVFTTWIVNRRLTFADRHSELPLHREFLRYLVVCLGGGSVNLVVYFFIVFMFGLAGWWLLIGVAIGSLAGMGINFAFSKRYVFSAKKPASGDKC